MSQICTETIACPRCAAAQEMILFRSLNGERVPAQVASLLDGSFEQRACTACGHGFRPEHRMLYTHVPDRAWIVMYPRSERHRYVTLEHGIALLFQRTFAGAPDIVAPLLRDTRPRLVFGQHMLAESVRVATAGLEAAVLECVKLLAYRRHLARLVPHGPAELCLEQARPGEDLQLGVYPLATGQRADALAVPAAMLDEVTAARAVFEREYPELFRQPYVSATRYLYATGVIPGPGPGPGPG